MKHVFLLFGYLFLVNTISAQSISVNYAKTITAEELKKHLTYIASDELEGRDTGSEGQRKAANYIANHFQSLGLTAIIPGPFGSRSYFQKFNLFKNGWQDGYIKVGNNKQLHFKEYYPNGLVSIPEEVTSELLFVNKVNENGNYKGKGVITFENGDKDIDKTTTEAAFKAGASYLFLISNADTDKFQTLAAERQAVLSRFNRMRLEANENASKPSSSPSFVVSPSLAAEMLGTSSKKIAKAKKTQKNNLKPLTIALKSQRGEELVETMNVLGFMEGTDKKDEVVVITAHYDHVGIDSKGQIYNGADDDGSGTCSILELAEAFAKAKAEGNGPRRSILFMTVTGEEKGLLGSRYFTDISPAIPLKQLVCDLNIDMIGRIDKDHTNDDKYVYLIGSDKLSSELHAISENANKEHINFKLDYTYNDANDPNRFYYRSDHYNFAKNNIPVVFYFTGVHEDYHRPGDDVEKILFPKYQQIVRLVFHTAWDVANRNERIVVDSNKK